jgi:hypothetical protein
VGYIRIIIAVCWPLSKELEGSPDTEVKAGFCRGSIEKRPGVCECKGPVVRGGALSPRQKEVAHGSKD